MSNNIIWIQYRNPKMGEISERDWYSFLLECSTKFKAKTGKNPEIININRVTFPAALADRLAHGGAEVLRNVPAWAVGEVWLGYRHE